MVVDARGELPEHPSYCRGRARPMAVADGVRNQALGAERPRPPRAERGSSPSGLGHIPHAGTEGTFRELPPMGHLR